MMSKPFCHSLRACVSHYHLRHLLGRSFWKKRNYTLLKVTEDVFIAFRAFRKRVNYICYLLRAKLVLESKDVLLNCLKELYRTVLALGIGQNSVRDALWI